MRLRHPINSALTAGSAYFGIVFAAGFVLGLLRVLILAPRLGETVAILIELPLILLVSWIVCGWLIRVFTVAAAAGPRLAMGGAAFLFLMAAELALSVFAFGRPVSTHWQHYLTLAGALGLTGQIAFAAFPYLMLSGTPHTKPQR